MNSNHPRWLEPEKAQLLDQNGFRRDAARDIYVAANGFRISESQLLVHDVESLQRLVVGKLEGAVDDERIPCRALFSERTAIGSWSLGGGEGRPHRRGVATRC